MAKSRKRERPEETLTRITKKFEQFLVRNLKIIILSLGAAILVAAAYFSIDYFLEKKETAAESAFSKVYLSYSTTSSDTSLSEQEVEEKLMSVADEYREVIEQYPKSSAASRSAYYIGNIMYRFEKYEEALLSYQQGALIKPKGYSALLSLQGEASCHEQMGEYEKAENSYNRIIDLYTDSFLIPMVRFSLAQIYEKQARYEDARNEYDRIVTDYSWSSWAGLAEKKILVLSNS
jgi:tetratricopeptide (TPR) repeat protein